MPIKRASMKSMRQANKRRARNLVIKQSVKKAEKTVRKAIEAKDKAKATEALAAAIKVIDRAKQKGTLKANTAARSKSRLHAAVKKLA